MYALYNTRAVILGHYENDIPAWSFVTFCF